MSDTISAIIPAKGISNRLPQKNTLPFGDSNLLIHKIRQLKCIDKICEIIVSSEDDEILDMASKEGVRAIKRPFEYSEETRPFQEFLHYIVGEASEEHIMWSCCTSPMVDVDTYLRACDTYFKKLAEGFDSLITVLEYHHYLLDKDMNPFTFKWGPEHKNSQELDKLYFFTDGIQLAPRKSMLEWSYYFGHNPYGLEVDLKTSIDIDTIYDYLLARMMFYFDENKMKESAINIKNGADIYDYLLAQMVASRDDNYISKLVDAVGAERIGRIVRTRS